MSPKRLMTLTILALMMVMAFPLMAQDYNSLLLAAVQDHNIWLFGFDDAPRQITDGSARDYSNLVWSADGNTLAFVAHDQDFNPNLMLYDRSSNTTTLVASDIADGFPVSFAFDSSQLFYVKEAAGNGASPQFKMDFYVYDIGSGAQATLTATFDFGVGCGGGSPFPADWRYWAETSGLGGFHLVLEVTPYGLVHSKDCGGGETSLLNLQTGEDVSLGQLSRPAVSGDRTKVAGIIDLAGTRENERLVVVDLQSGQRTELATIQTPDQVAWAAGGSSVLYYSTRQPSGEPLPLTEEEIQRLVAVVGEGTILSYNEVSLHRFDLNTNTDTELYRDFGYATGRMTALFGGNTLIFSQVPNMVDWYRAIADGTIDNQGNSNYMEDSEQLVLVELRSLPLDGGPVSLIGADLNMAAINPASS